MPSISTYFDYAQYKSLDGTGAEVVQPKGVEVSKAKSQKNYIPNLLAIAPILL
ncbi:hypothetical protein [Nostoc sp.]|uniref:hypothetical protein n=1 Tax=Nostoc sp. TaxID=1180 RepID=UPI002FFBC92A